MFVQPSIFFRGLASAMFLALALASLPPAKAARVELDLSGAWQSQKVPALAYPPPSTNWTACTVPGYLTGWNYEHAWFRKTFEVPASMAGTQLKLRFGGVKFNSQVWLNGVFIGAYVNGYEPFEYDVTARALPGQTNELVVGVTDWTALFSQPVDFSTLPSGQSPRDFTKNTLLAPIGGRYDLYGVWQPVKLVSVPAVSITEVFVMPSVRTQQITVRIALRNDSASAQTVALGSRVLENGAPILALPAAQAVVPPGAITNLEVTSAWTNARLWSHLDPHLYSLETTAACPAGTDQLLTRFGFREFWTLGDRCFLNGTPVNLLASATWPPASFITDAQIRKVYQDVKAGNNIAMRLHTQPWDERWYDLADEEGMLIVEEAAVWCDPGAYRLADPVFWANYSQHLTAAVKRDWNHPAIIVWSLENEILHCGGAGFFTNTETRLAEMGRVVKSADPTRPITYEADLDPGGEAQFVGLHYPYEFPDHTVWPNSAYWMDQFIPRSWVPGGTWRWDRAKPLYIGEFLWVPATSAQDFTILFGDDAYSDSGYYRNQAKALTWRMQIEAYRSYGVNGIGPWTMFEDPAVVSSTFDLNPASNTLYQAQQAAYHPNAVFVEEYSPRFFAGETATRNLRVYHERMTPGNLQLRWRAGAGAWQSRSFAMQPATQRRETVTFAVPSAPGPFALQIEVADGASTVFSNRIGCSALARPLLVRPPGATLGVFDPSGGVAALLARFNIPFASVPNLATEAYTQFNLLVIGRNALTNDATTPAGRLTIAAKWQEFMIRGGWILVCEQTNYPAWMPAGLRLASLDASHAFPNPDHPVTRGLSNEDLRWWASDHRVVNNAIAMPSRGSFRPLAGIGSKSGLEYAAALEVPIGAGGLIASQWTATERYDIEPLAGPLLQRMLDYCAPSATRPALRPAGLISETTSPAAAKLASLGLLCDLLPSPPSNLSPLTHPVVVIAGSDALWLDAAARLTNLAAYASNGGTLLLHRPSSAFIAAARPALFPFLEPVDANLGQVLRRTTTNSAARLTSHDLFWIETPGSWNQEEVLSTNVARRFYRKQFNLPSYSTIQAETMPVHTAGNAAAGGWWLYSSGYAAQNITNTQSGTHLFSIKAKGTLLAGVGPLMSLKIDGRAADSITVTSTQLAFYTLSADLAPGPHQLAISFDNDAYAPPEDRNLFLDEIRWGFDSDTSTTLLTAPGVVAQSRLGNGWVVLDEISWETESRNATKAGRYASTLLTGLGAALRLPSVTSVEAETMTNVNIAVYTVTDGVVQAASGGRIRSTVNFTTPGRYTFELLASGRPLSNIWPVVAFELDGAARTNITVNSSNLTRFTFTLSVTAGVHTIGLNYLNDQYAPPEDRNVAYDRLSLWPETPPPGPPLINLLQPAPGALFTNGVPVILSADAADFDGPIAKVAFFADGALLGEAPSLPYTLAWSNAPVGPHTITATATDNTGLCVTSAAAPVTIVALASATLVPSNAVWRYFDRATDLGTAWRGNTFNDAAWSNGPAMLGFGDANGLWPATPIASNNQWTAYFRRAFYIPDAAQITGLTARLLRDDGAVVYLNGAEVWRDNMPSGSVTNATPASSNINGTNESAWVTKSLNTASLVSGTNLVAAEIHQSSLSSSDLAFAFELAATVLLLAAPKLELYESGPSLVARWPAADPGAFDLWKTTNLAPPAAWTRLTNAPSLNAGSWQIPLPAPASPAGFFRLQAR